MSEFEKWFRSLNANGKTVYFLGNEHKVSEMAWNHQQAIIDNLKAQLNNMEACYIEVKKELEDQQKRIDEVLQEVKGLERFTGEDCIADFDVLQGAVSHACKRLEKTLRGAND